MPIPEYFAASALIVLISLAIAALVERQVTDRGLAHCALNDE